MKKSFLIVLFFSVVYLGAEEVYMLDGDNDSRVIAKQGYIFAEDSAFLEEEDKRDIVKTPTTESKIFSLDDENTSECTAIKTGCGSSR